MQEDEANIQQRMGAPSSSVTPGAASLLRGQVLKDQGIFSELRRGLPVGLVWGETDGKILLHPDEAVSGAIGAVFTRFAECGGT